MLKTRSVFLMIYRPGPAATPRTTLNPTLATRQLSTSTATMPTTTGQEAAKDFIQFVNDSPTRSSLRHPPPPTAFPDRLRLPC